MAKTHDYINQHWGHAVSLITPQPDGTVRMMGHGLGIKVGDQLLMKMESGKVGRMKVHDVEYLSDPRDMWKLIARFDGYVAAAQPTQQGERNA